MTELSDTGLATRRRVLGPAHVARAQAAQTPFDAPFQALITDAAWGHVWSRGTIPLRERSMMTIALLAGLGNDGELALHLRSIPNTGTSRDDVGLVQLFWSFLRIGGLLFGSGYVIVAFLEAELVERLGVLTPT